MNGSLPAAVDVGDRLSRAFSNCNDFRGRQPESTQRLVRSLVAARRCFGITRIGSLSRLDRAGVSVAQVVRPLSLSNAVSQGKGENIVDAAASAFMEALECWAAERLEHSRVSFARARDLGNEMRDLYAGCRVHSFDAGWDQLRLGWVDGYDLLTARVVPVPLALVDTVYTLPSPHPVAFPRSTRGLAAGSTVLAAIIHAALEILERANLATAERYPHRYPEHQIDPASAPGQRSARILARLAEADLAVGAWLVPGDHDLPVFRCEVIETERRREIAPMPGEGSACDFTLDDALASALLEAAQARVTALGGSREDITRASYPKCYDRVDLAARRNAYRAPADAIQLSADAHGPASGAAALHIVLRALREAGGQAVIVVPLYSNKDPVFEVVRLVVPPLPDLFHD